MRGRGAAGPRPPYCFRREGALPGSSLAHRPIFERVTSLDLDARYAKESGRAETPARARSPAARAPSVGQLARSPTVHRSCGLARLSASSLLGRCARFVVTRAVDVTRRRWKRPLRGPGALRVGGGGFWPAVSLRRSSPQQCRPAGDGAGRIRSPRRRTTESSSKHQKYCGLGPRLRARCGHPQLDGRVRGRKGGEAGTSRTSGSGSRAQASFPS
jgi:hypothetical protein